MDEFTMGGISENRVSIRALQVPISRRRQGEYSASEIEPGCKIIGIKAGEVG